MDYLVNIKAKMKILSVFVAFLEDMNFTYIAMYMGNTLLLGPSTNKIWVDLSYSSILG